MKVVLAFDSGLESGVRDSVRGGLVAEGLECVDSSAAPAEHALPVVIVARTEDGAKDCVRGLRDAGVPRLLAILTAELPPGAAARLLMAGCGDVAAWSQGTACRVARRLERWRRVDQLESDAVVGARLAGEAPAFRAFLSELVEVAAFGRSGVLLLGESGTGKEAAARVVHSLDARPDKREMLTVDCTTLTPELLGSELFGHERGAFTGASSSRDGAVALADGGTLFLDEVGELPLALQPQLLRVLQERTYKPVGANYWKTSRFRLVCATNRTLEAEVEQGRFRADLYHRISASVVRVPSLRERASDIPLLARHFLDQLLPGAAPVALDQELEAYLVTRPYPGNVRELFRLMETIAVHHPGVGRACLADLPAAERARAVGAIAEQGWRDEGFELPIRRALLLGASAHEVENAARDAVKRLAIAQAGGNLPLAARRLGLSERALQKWRAELQATDRAASRNDEPVN